MVLSQATNSSGISASMMEVTPEDEIKRCMFWTSLNITSQTRI